MDLTFSPAEESFRQEVRDFISAEANPQLEEALKPRADDTLQHLKHEWFRKLGSKGWYVPTLPKEYGGIGASYMQRYIIYDEISYHHVPTSAANLSEESCIVAPSIMMYGTEEQKKTYVPRIARGEIDFGLGYSERNAGSDLGALSTRAVENGDHFIINGGKMFCTHIHHANYLWLAARTDTTLGKSKGISLFILDPKSPGITIRGFRTMDGYRTNEVFFDDVRVPRENLVGEKNKGFHHIAVSLVYYRNFVVGFIRREFEELVTFTKETKRDGQPLAQDPVVRQKLADIAIELELANLLGLRVVWMLDNGQLPEWEGMMAKLFGTELASRFATTAIEIMGPRGVLKTGSKWSVMRGSVDQTLRENVRDLFVRGSSEIVRNTLALRALGLPRE